MNMVKEGKQDEAETVLAAGFQKQDEGTFDAAYLQAVMEKYYELIRPECTEQLKQAMAHFASQM